MLLAAGVACLASPAGAQTRGTATQGQPIDELLRGSAGQAAADGLPQPFYEPVSAGAVPEDAEAGENDVTADGNPPAEPAEAERPQNVRSDGEADDTVTGATVREPTIDSADDVALDAGAARAEPIEGRNLGPEENPFEATGIRMGTFILRPTVEQGLTATSNADSSTTGGPAVLSETTLRLNAASDWASHSLTVDAYGTYRTSISGDEVDDAAAGIDATLQLDLANDYRAIARLGYAMAPESAASPVIITGAASEPLRQTVTGSLALEKDVGKARFRITGGVEDDNYGDAELEGGGVLSQRDRDATLYTLALRAGYEISPALTPFVETEVGRKRYDLAIDSAGYARSSDRVAVRGGIAFDHGEKLRGEISAGWTAEEFDDGRLDSLSAPSLAGEVAWSPMRGTVVTLSGSTTLEGTTTPGESGSVLHAGSLSVQREMRANLTGNALLGAGWRDYSASDGHDLILSAEAGLTWWWNRYAGLTTRIRHERVESNLADRNSETNSVFLGLKLQR